MPPMTVVWVVWLAMLPLFVTEVEPNTSLTERRPDWARMMVWLLTTCERRQLVESSFSEASETSMNLASMWTCLMSE